MQRTQFTEVLSVKEVAEYLGISESVVRKLIRESKIPFIRIERRILFFVPVIRQWLLSSVFQPDPKEDNGTTREVQAKAKNIWDKMQGEQ